MSIKFSIIIATYNYGNFIHRAINSILTQRNTQTKLISYEIIIIDDCSTDDTQEVIKQFDIIYNNIKVISNSINLGPAKSRNLGIKAATGNYVIFLDADDWLTEDAFYNIYQFITIHNQPCVIIADHNNINHSNLTKISQTKNKNISPNRNTRFVDYLFKKKISLTAGSVIYKKNVLEHFGYAEHLKLNEDIPLFAHTLANFDCLYLDYATVNILKHSDSLRNQYQKITEQSNVIDLTNIIFTQGLLPAELMKLKNRYLGQRYLSLFRSFYCAKQYAQAKLFYHKAIKTKLINLFKINYLIKYLKILLIQY